MSPAAVSPDPDRPAPPARPAGPGRPPGPPGAGADPAEPDAAGPEDVDRGTAGEDAGDEDGEEAAGRSLLAASGAQGLGPAFGPLHFQLVLLRRMADHQGELVAEALRELRVSRADLREANRRWQAMVRSPRQQGAVRRYRSVLGPPQAVGRRRIGDLTCEALSWPVPLWPTLRFEVLAGPGGAVWNEWLVRAPGAAGPTLRTATDLAPWSCTVDEVARAFAPARPLEGTAPTRWRLAFTALAGPAEPGGDGAPAPEPYVAEFTWGLLQRVTRAG
ncbi:hypothetical protein GCM10023324_34590 [Streptomyces youssoufiensis]